MSDQPSVAALSIDSILGRLSSESALRSMILGQLDAHFPLLGTLINYADQPISKAAEAKASASFNPTKACSWKPTNGFVFSFSPSARCTIAVSASSETFDVAMNIESISSTEKVSATAPRGSVYINIDLDFAIQGNVSVTAPLGTIGISGKASGSQAASLSCSLPVAGTLSTPDAIREAFETFVFPLDPACLGRLRTGTLLKVAFDANLSCDLDVTYGLGNYKVAAPDLNSVQASMKNLVGFKPPSTSVDVGVKGSFSYIHSGDFSLIINRTGEATAKMYLTRSSEDDADASLGVSAQVTTCVPALKVDPTALQTVAQDITKNAAVAKQVASATNGGTNELIIGLIGKLTNWAKDGTGTVGLTAGLSRQKGHVALFVFDVDLTQPTVSEGWKQLVDGTPLLALSHTGFTLDQGSGISDSLTRAATLKFQFFNLFAFTSTEEYFNNSFAEIGKDGSIQIVHEIGREHDDVANKRQRKIRFYFEATATQSPSSVSISNAQVDLCMELSETGNSVYGATLANVIGFLPSTASTNDAQEQMIAYVHSKPAGTLDLKFTLKQSAYRRISASPFKGKTPPPLP